MKRNQEAESANDKNKKKNVKSRIFFHVDQHGQSCVNILKAKKMEKRQRTKYAN